MSRPRKDTQLAFYDEFYSWDVAEQAIALRILQEHHRLELKRKPKKQAAESQAESADAAMVTRA